LLSLESAHGKVGQTGVSSIVQKTISHGDAMQVNAQLGMNSPGPIHADINAA
jgi:hypothetical protein